MRVQLCVLPLANLCCQVATLSLGSGMQEIEDLSLPMSSSVLGWRMGMSLVLTAFSRVRFHTFVRERKIKYRASCL